MVSLDVIVEFDDGDTATVNLGQVRELGKGAGGIVSLVNAEGNIVAEKMFVNSGFTGVVAQIANAVFLQTPNPYRRNYHATRSAYHRRKSLELLTTFWFGKPRIARALYTRFDVDKDAFALGTEFIEGGGFDYRNKAAVNFLDALTFELRNAGFLGTTWQTNPRLLVTTTNIRIMDSGEAIVVDTESATPAVHPIALNYAFTGLSTANFPLFDDTDYKRLASFLQQHSADLQHALGSEAKAKLEHHIERLHFHEHTWKIGELAFLRHGLHLAKLMPRKPSAVASYFSEVSSAYRDRNIMYWLKSGQITESEAAEFTSGKPGILEHMVKEALFYRPTRRFHGLGFLTDEEASKLREVSRSASVQTKDVIGTMAILGLSAALPGLSVASVAAFFATNDYVLLIPALLDAGIKTTFNAANYAYSKIKERGSTVRRNGHWPFVFAFGLLPGLGSFAYPFSILLDNKQTLPLYKLRARSVLASTLRAIPFYGHYHSRFVQGALQLYDSVVYRQGPLR